MRATVQDVYAIVFVRRGQLVYLLGSQDGLCLSFCTHFTLQPFADGVGDLVGRALAAKVWRSDLSLLEDGVYGLVDSVGIGLEARVFEHERGRTDGSDGVCNARRHVGNVGGGTVHGLSEDEAVPCIHRWHEPERSDKRGRSVRDDVPVEVWRDESRELFWLTEESVEGSGEVGIECVCESKRSRGTGAGFEWRAGE